MDTEPTKEPAPTTPEPTDQVPGQAPDSAADEQAGDTNTEVPTPPAPEQVFEPNADSAAMTEASTAESEPTSDVPTDSVAPVPAQAIPVRPNGSVTAKKSRKKLRIALVVLLLLAATGGAYAYYKSKKTTPNPSGESGKAQATAKSKEEQKTAATDPQLQRFMQPTTGETWYAAYKTLPSQGFSTTTGNEADFNIKYFEIGKRGSNVIIARQKHEVITETDLFEKAPDGTISYIVQPNANVKTTYNKDSADIKSTIKIDQNTHYDSLSVPQKLTLDNGEVLTYDIAYLGEPSDGNPDYQKPTDTDNNSKNTEKSVKKLGGSELFEKRIAYNDTKLTALSYNVVLPIKTRVSLTYRPVGTSYKETTWNNGYKSDEKYLGIVRGCGSTSNSISIGNAVTESDLVAAGKTTDGITLYDFKDKNNTLVQKAYNETKEFYKDDTTFPYKNVTIDEFMRDHAVFAAKSKNGEWFILSSDKYAPAGGCAKPVVYLYPTVPTKVTVRVGADVKVSDPLYDAKKGWTVLANPNGQLTTGGKTYGSLFWEGPGWGTYPGIASGTVVPRAQAAATMRSQLFAQGLNTQETQDFMDYWASRIPNKPYVRLTWFSTNEINRLAPLSVKPKPTTVFRVFLDMDGFDQLISLPAQKLQKLDRRDGFTVVEWGGLSHTKLY